VNENYAQVIEFVDKSRDLIEKQAFFCYDYIVFVVNISVYPLNY